MASAHGAGLMLAPILLKWPAGSQARHVMAYAGLMAPMGAAASPAVLIEAVGVHTAGLLLVTGAIAVLVYEKVGLAFLRRAWVNFDLLWALALLVAGVLAFLLS
jgi:hypothetical protein